MVPVSFLVLPIGPMPLLGRKFRARGNSGAGQPGLEFCYISEDYSGPVLGKQSRPRSPRLAILLENTDKRNLRRLGGQRVVHIVAHVERPRSIALSHDFQQAFGVWLWPLDVLDRNDLAKKLAHPAPVERVVRLCSHPPGKE